MTNAPAQPIPYLSETQDAEQRLFGTPTNGFSWNNVPIPSTQQDLQQAESQSIQALIQQAQQTQAQQEAAAAAQLEAAQQEAAAAQQNSSGGSGYGSDAGSAMGTSGYAGDPLYDNNGNAYSGGGSSNTSSSNYGNDYGDPNPPIYTNGNFGGGGGDDGPVVLDLAGKGISITPLTSSNTYEDVTGDGYKSRTAWAGAGNGVLFIDTTGQGQLTQANQVIFTDWDPGATTDMQALLDVFDTNHDGKLDAGDADFSKFFLMVTNADGTETAHSLTSLGITSIDLNANAVNVALPDGSSIDGETTFTMTNPTTGVTTTNVAATVSLRADANGYVVSTSATTNADGSETIANVARNADSSLAYESILNTSANGLNKTLTELNSGGVVSTIQIDNTVVNADGSTTETLTNYAGGAIQANGELPAAGTSGSEKLNSTTTTTSANIKVVTFLRDLTGGGWTAQQEVDTSNADGSRSIVISNLNPDGSVSSVTTTNVSADGLTRNVTSLVDGIAADSTTQSDVTVVSGATRTETETDSVGTSVVRKIVTVTQTSTNSVTRTTTSDLTDGTTLDRTSVSQTLTNADGSTTTTQSDSAANGILLDETVTQLSADGLLKTTSTDSTGAVVSGSPVFDTVVADDTVVNGDGSRTETVTTTSANGTQLSRSVTNRAASGPGRTVTVYGNGDGAVTQSETVVVNATTGATTATVSNLNADGSLVNQTVTVTSADGLSKTTQVDSTGAVSGGASVFDRTTTDVTVDNSDGSSTETVTTTGATTSNLVAVTKTTISANGLTKTVDSDFTGPDLDADADGSWDRIAVDQTTVNADGSLTETITLSNGSNQVLSQVVKTTSADRKTATTTTTEGTTGLVDQVETVATQSSGAVVDSVVSFDKNGDVLKAVVTTTSADGLTRTVQDDSPGQTAAAYAAGGLVFDSTTTVTSVINADGSRTATTDVTSGNGALVSASTTTTSANGLSVTSTSNPFATAHYASQATDVTTLNADGSTTKTVSTASYSGALTGRTTTTTSANGLSTTVLYDVDGDGVIDQSTTDFTMINANGSRTEVVTDYTGSTSGPVRDVTTTTSGIIVAGAGLETTITRQSNGAVPTYQVETVLPSANGTVTDTVQYYASAGGSLLKTVITTTSANGLSKTVSTELGTDTTADFYTTDQITLNAIDSQTETVANYNKAGLINETATYTLANGLTKITRVDANGAVNSSGAAVFDAILFDSTALNLGNTSRSESVSNLNANSATTSQVSTTVSTDGQTVTTNHYLDETGTIGTVDQSEIVQTQADGSKVDTVTTYGTTNALLGTVTTTTTGNGLGETKVYRNAAGNTVDTQSDTKTWDANGDGGFVVDLEDSDIVGGTALTSSVKKQSTANGQNSTTTMLLTGVLLSTIAESFSAVSHDSIAIADNGATTETVTDAVNGASTANDTTITVTSADGLSKTSSTALGTSSAYVQSTATTNPDGSKTKTTTYYDPDNLSLILDQETVNTSYDGRVITTVRQSDYDQLNQTVINNPYSDLYYTATDNSTYSGPVYNVETDTVIANADGTTTEKRAGTGSFGAPAYQQVRTIVTNTDESVSTTTRNFDGLGVLTGQSVLDVSANGLNKALVLDTTGRETSANLNGAAAALVNGTTLPASLLLTDIVGLDSTVLNADGSKTDTITTGFGSLSNLRSKTVTTTSANGLVTTANIDNDGNGINERVDTTTVAPDGSRTLVSNFYGNTAATASTLQGSNTYTTSANGMVNVLTTSNGITDTTVKFANANGSYQFSRVVAPGSAAAGSGIVNGYASHDIDANGIDTWSYFTGYDTAGGSGEPSSITIDLATEQQDIAEGDEISLAVLGHTLDDSEKQYLAAYITDGVLNREKLAYDLINSAEYQSNFVVPLSTDGVHKSYITQGFEISAAFENVLGRLPTAEEMGVFDQYLTVPNTNGLWTNSDDLATMAVALAQYATDLGGGNNRTASDPNADLISAVAASPPFINAASTSVQISAVNPTTYALSGQFITICDTKGDFQGVTATINGNNNIIYAYANSNLTVNGFNNSIDTVDGTFQASNASILVQLGSIATITGSNDQITQVGPTQITLSSGTGDAIYVAPAGALADASVENHHSLTAPTTNASNASITFGSGVGTQAAPAQVSGSNDTITLDGNDDVTVSGSSNTINVLGSNDVVTVSNATINVAAGVQNVSINGTGNTVNYAASPPTVTITSPAEAGRTASQTIAGVVTSGGAAVVGQTVTLTDNGVTVGTATVQLGGSFTAQVTLPNQGANSIVAVVTDSAGNTGTSAAVVDTLDNIAPVVTFISAAGAGTTWTIAGEVTSGGAAVVAGQIVTLTENGTTLGTATVQPNGSFAVQVTLPNQGVNPIVASVTDSYGNTGTAASTLNNLAPTVTITSTAVAGKTATQTISGTVTANGSATVAGKTVTLMDNGAALGTATVQADGSFAASVTLPNQGANSIVAVVTDSAGNTGTSAAVVDTLDSTAPKVTIANIAEATGVATQTIVGKVTSGGAATVAGQIVTFTENGAALGTATIQPDGSFTARVTLPSQGSNSILASVTDSYGNAVASTWYVVNNASTGDGWSEIYNADGTEASYALNDATAKVGESYTESYNEGVLATLNGTYSSGTYKGDTYVYSFGPSGGDAALTEYLGSAGTYQYLYDGSGNGRAETWLQSNGGETVYVFDGTAAYNVIHTGTLLLTVTSSASGSGSDTTGYYQYTEYLENGVANSEEVTYNLGLAKGNTEEFIYDASGKLVFSQYNDLNNYLGESYEVYYNASGTIVYEYAAYDSGAAGALAGDSWSETYNAGTLATYSFNDINGQNGRSYTNNYNGSAVLASQSGTYDSGALAGDGYTEAFNASGTVTSYAVTGTFGTIALINGTASTGAGDLYTDYHTSSGQKTAEVGTWTSGANAGNVWAETFNADGSLASYAFKDLNGTYGSSYTNSYSGSGLLMSESGIYDTTVLKGDGYTYTYHADGSVATYSVTGAVASVTLNPANSTTVVGTNDVYADYRGSTGQRTAEVGTWTSGTLANDSFAHTYNPDGTLAWSALADSTGKNQSSYTESYNEGVLATENGAWTGSFVYAGDTFAYTFGSSGAAATFTENDIRNLGSWDSEEYFYDGSGNLRALSATMDDGDVITNVFDGTSANNVINSATRLAQPTLRTTGTGSNGLGSYNYAETFNNGVLNAEYVTYVNGTANGNTEVINYNASGQEESYDYIDNNGSNGNTYSAYFNKSGVVAYEFGTYDTGNLKGDTWSETFNSNGTAATETLNDITGKIGSSYVNTYNGSGVLVSQSGKYDSSALAGESYTETFNANGSVASYSVSGSAGNNTLTGSSAAPSTLIGNGGYDTYEFGRGSGQERIVNGTGTGTAAQGELDIGGGVATRQLWLQRSGNDLLIDIMGTHDQVDVANWFGTSPDAQLVRIVTSDGSVLDGQINQLVQSMATYSANNSGFNPTVATQAPNDPSLQGAIGSAWHH